MLKSNLMAVLTVLLLPLYAAAVPNYINYQGRLVDNNGNPMSGSKAVTFRICDTLAGACSATCSVGNTCLWDEPQTVTLENGIFSVKLGSVDPLTSAVYAADDRFLEVVVDAVTLAPRVQLVSVPFALSAGNITSATGVSISTYITVAGHVTASKFYGDGSALTGLGAGAIADGSITTAKLADNAITTIKITDANVTTAKIADSNVTDAKIASLSASKLTGSVPATHVDLSTVTAALGTKLANTVTVPVTLVDLSTVTTALGGKISTGGDGSSLLGISSVALAGFYDDAAVRARLGLGIGSAVQAWDTDLDDLLDGSLSGSKVGSGVPAGNIASGTLGSGVISSSIAFNAMYTQSICAAGQVLKAAAGAWACGTDETGAGGTVTGAGLAGQLSYWATGSSLSGSNSLFWDTVNFRLGIGNATPSSALHVTGDITVSGNVDGRDVSADATTLTNHVANVTNPHSVTKTQVGLSNVTNDAQIPLVQKAAANGVAALNADSKLNTDYLAGTIVSTHVVDGSIAAADLASGVFDIGNFTSGSLNGDLLGATIVSTNIVNGTIADADIAAGAAIAKSKLASLAIVNADVDGAAAIAYSKLSLANSVVTGDIFDGTIANGDLAASGFDLTKFTAGSLNGDLLGATIVSTNIVNVGMDKLVQTPVTIVQAAYTVTSTDTVVYADCTAATVAITLPAATASNIGKEIYLYRVDGSLNDVTFAADAGDSIVGGAASPLAAADQWKYVRFIVYDEATWIANKSN